MRSKCTFPAQPPLPDSEDLERAIALQLAECTCLQELVRFPQLIFCLGSRS